MVKKTTPTTPTITAQQIAEHQLDMWFSSENMEEVYDKFATFYAKNELPHPNPIYDGEGKKKSKDAAIQSIRTRMMYLGKQLKIKLPQRKISDRKNKGTTLNTDALKSYLEKKGYEVTPITPKAKETATTPTTEQTPAE